MIPYVIPLSELTDAVWDSVTASHAKHDTPDDPGNGRPPRLPPVLEALHGP